MDITALASLGTVLSQARLGDAVGVSVLKKAMDIQEQSALQLLQALPQPYSNPLHLGNSIDVRA